MSIIESSDEDDSSSSANLDNSTSLFSLSGELTRSANSLFMNNSFEDDIVNFMTAVIEQEDGDPSKKQAMYNNALALLDKLKGRNAASSSNFESSFREIVEEYRPSTSRSENSSLIPSVDCPICMESLFGRSGTPLSSTKCGHVFCEQCINASLTNSKLCPTCREEISASDVHPIYLS